MEFTPLVPLRFSPRVLALTGAELAEVFCGAWGDVGEELHFYAAEGFTWDKLGVSYCFVIRVSSFIMKKYHLGM